MIDAADDADGAVAAVDRAEATLAPEDYCPFCTVMLAVPAARACAAVGDLDRARRWFGMGQAVEARWEGTSLEAALLEVRAAICRAEGGEHGAKRLLAAAADLFDRSGQPLDAARCRAAVSAAALPTPRPPDSLPAAALT
jgi:ATP/maltotriose-dependent transcriptional regulator MalT